MRAFGSDLVDKVGAVKESVIDRTQNVGIARGLNGLFTLPERLGFQYWRLRKQRRRLMVPTLLTGTHSVSLLMTIKPENLYELGGQIAFQESVTIGSALLTGNVLGLTESRLGRLATAGIEAVMNPDVSTENNFSGSVKWIAENPDKSPEWVQDVYLQVERHVPWLGDGLRHVPINNPLATTEGDDVYTTTFKGCS